MKYNGKITDPKDLVTKEYVDNIADDKIDKVVSATDGNVATFDENGGIEDTGIGVTSANTLDVVSADTVGIDSTPTQSSTNLITSGGVYNYAVTSYDSTPGSPLPVNANTLEGHPASYFQTAETGKGLSTNDYTTAEKTKLGGIEANADVTDADNVKSSGATMGVKVAGTELVKDSDGKVDVPIGSSYDAYGVHRVRATAYEYGIGLTDNGSFYIDRASENNISNRAGGYRPITPDRLNFSVKSALTDSNKISLSNAEKLTACSTIGAENISNKVTSLSAQSTDVQYPSAKSVYDELAEANRKIAYLDKIRKGQGYDIDTNNETAYSVNVPSGAFRDNVLMVGGKSVVMNQLVDTSGTTATHNGITFTNNNNGSWTLNGTATDRAQNGVTLTAFDVVANHKLLVSGIKPEVKIATVWYNSGSYVSFTEYASATIVTVPSNVNGLNYQHIVSSGTTLSNVTLYPQVIDLTKMFGAGNEPSTVAEFKAMFPADYYTYNTGEVKSASVDEVVASGTNPTTIQIPSAIQQLDGYGQSNGTTYNYVDYANKKYHYFGKYVDGVWTPSEETITDISSLVAEDFLEHIEVEYGGTVTFKNSNGDDYHIPVNNTNEFIVNLNEVI